MNTWMLWPWKCVANNDVFDLHLSQVMSPLVSPKASFSNLFDDYSNEELKVCAEYMTQTHSISTHVILQVISVRLDMRTMLLCVLILHQLTLLYLLMRMFLFGSSWSHHIYSWSCCFCFNFMWSCCFY